MHTNEVETDGPKNWMLTLFGGANPGVEVADTGETLRCRVQPATDGFSILVKGLRIPCPSNDGEIQVPLIRQKFVIFRLSDDLLG